MQTLANDTVFYIASLYINHCCVVVRSFVHFVFIMLLSSFLISFCVNHYKSVSTEHLLSATAMNF